MKKLLQPQVIKSNAELEKKRPSLLIGGSEECGAPKKLYNNTDSIEVICSQFAENIRSAMSR